MPTADILYFKEKPTKEQILKVVKKRGWGQNPSVLSPAFDMKFIAVEKERFESY